MLGITGVLFAAAAQVQGAQTQQIPVRQLGPAEATASVNVDAITVVRPLSDGRALVAHRRRIMLFDSTLTTFTIAADSSSLTPGARSVLTTMAIIPYLADSTLITDANAAGFLLVDPMGKVSRVMAAPKASDIFLLSTGSVLSRTTTDSKGRLIYRGTFSLPRMTPPAPGMPIPLPVSDSFAIVRADFESRTVDTIGVVHTPSGSRMTQTVQDNHLTMRTTRNPLPNVDTWAPLPDGTIAILRGIDYHIDWIHPDGSRSSSPKMPFDWRRLSDDDKARIVDSVTKFDAAMRARIDSARQAAAAAAGAGGRGGRGGVVVTPSNVTQINEFVPPSELPDYYPPVREGFMRSDPDGNLWILPTTSASAQGGLLYDMVNRKGELFQRVQLPPNCSLNGLGRGGVVYLVCGTKLERRRIS